jgi:hypothetical protein
VFLIPVSLLEVVVDSRLEQKKARLGCWLVKEKKRRGRWLVQEKERSCWLVRGKEALE